MSDIPPGYWIAVIITLALLVLEVRAWLRRIKEESK